LSDTVIRPLARCVRIAAVTLLVVASEAALAQGGPPLVTDDPETPGNGHWEINLATIASHTSGRWEIAAPDVDINYGWGEHIQLKLDVPWNFVHETDQRWKSGLGAANVGVKWRFVDIEDSGFSMSTYPQFSWNWLSPSARRGISPSGRQFFLPIEAATSAGVDPDAYSRVEPSGSLTVICSLMGSLSSAWSATCGTRRG